VTDDDQIILITDKGRLIRTKVSSIRIAGRRTQGVIVLRIDDGEEVVGFTKVKEEAEDINDFDHLDSELNNGDNLESSALEAEIEITD